MHEELGFSVVTRLGTDKQRRVSWGQKRARGYSRGGGAEEVRRKGGIWAEALFWKQRLREEAGGHRGGGGQGCWEMRPRDQWPRGAKEHKGSGLTLEDNLPGWT